jgi:cytochrome c oxidase assembly factor CtaG
MPVFSLLLVVFGMYAAGVLSVWRNAGYGRGVRPIELIAFVSGWLALATALSPPLDGWSERWLSAHMVQHELLMIVAAPLMAVGGPIVGLLWAMPSQLRSRVVAAVHRHPMTAVWSILTSPPWAFCVYGIGLWVWHLPALYNYALEHEAVHVVQHLCFFGTATLFWWGIAHGRHGRLGYGAAVVYVFATAVHGGLLGALLTVSPRVWYAPYVLQHHAGFTPLEDQQLAGLLMWVPASLVFVAAGLLLFGEWLRHSDRMTRFKSGPVLGPNHVI